MDETRTVRVAQQPVGKDAEHQAAVDKEAEAAEDKKPLASREVNFRKYILLTKLNLLQGIGYMSTVTISAQDINKLRQMTGAGMMDCRKALTETNGDFEAAIDWLRKQGQKVAAKRSDREAKEGVVIAKTTADNKTGIVVCVSCETDFVSKNADFVAFAQSYCRCRHH